MFEIVFEVLLEIPGAFVLWLINGKEGPFADYLAQSNSFINYAVGIVFWSFILAPFYL
jgi:uncharacterized Tic20 family protein